MFIQEVRSEGHVAVGGRGVSLTAWVIQKGPGNTAGRLNCGPSPDPCVIPLTLSLKSVHLLAAPASSVWLWPGCLQGRDILWAWIILHPTTCLLCSEAFLSDSGAMFCLGHTRRKRSQVSSTPGCSSNTVNPRQDCPHLSRYLQPSSTTFSLNTVSFLQGTIPKNTHSLLQFLPFKSLPTSPHLSPTRSPFFSTPCWR